MDNKLNIGGQAVIDGVMMKSLNYVSVAVRKADKTIIVKELPYTSISKRYKFLGWPFFRGVVMLFEMLVLGIKALTFSANESLDEEETKEKEELSDLSIALTIFFSLLFGVVLFVIVPYALTVLIGIHEEKTSILFNLIDGVIKLTIFVLYVVLIGMLKDIQRVFQYHGAEHKAVNCYESGKKLNVKNCQGFSTLNPRCGTSFLLFVIFLGIIVFSFVPIIITAIWPGVMDIGVIWRKLIFLAARLLFLLPLAAISYEFLKITAKKCNNFIIKILMQPGLYVQKLTTKEPTDDMVEIAIKAIEDVLRKEKKLNLLK
ncbi:MAG: DUF1385 domain-containing protein [Candidatus Woesearchaeota archaeon]